MTATSRSSREWFWGGEEPEWLVIVTLLVALTLGALLMAMVTTRTSVAGVGELSLRYPADWVQGAADAAAFSAGNLGSATRVSARVLRELDPAAPVALDDVVAQHGFDQAESRAMYRVLASDRVTLGGQAAVALRYAYVADLGGAGRGSVPVVMEGIDYIVPYGARVYLVALEAEAEALQADERLLERIARSVQFE